MHILKQQSKTETGGPGVGGEKTWKEVTIRRTAVIVGQRLERILRYSHLKEGARPNRAICTAYVTLLNLERFILFV